MEDLFSEKSREFCEVLFHDPELCKQLVKLLAGDEIEDFEIDTKYGMKLHDYPYGAHIYVPCVGCDDQEYDVRIMTATEYGAHFKRQYFDKMHQEMEYLLPDPDTPTSIVIMLCNYDVAKDERIRHVSRRVCWNAPKIVLSRGIEIYISATPETACDESALGKLADYLINGVPTDDITKRFHDGLTRLKSSK